ncbi:transposase [Roseomonas sp. KE2513]|uniref:integrase catalytic domain-containing protein n=1 Tax=Roseomonas sp. KE2513 TaxID=2479202 RepID=UPI0018DF8AE0|nr:DDE-type integrase/transposase/recombinase [Roseomonas sp. KE2513]MBI0539511.1 transposase [Roseomonas sp. KE2513]
MRRVSMATRDELVAVTAERYARAGRGERGLILDEFTAVTGFHRRHSTRLLRSGIPSRAVGPRPGRRVYDDAVREALVVLWEASDRVCGKRLRPLVPVLVEAMERNGHLQLAPEVRVGLLAMSAATMDRALRQARDGAGGRRRRRTAPSAAVRRSVPVRTFSDWGDPSPGYVEADLVAHSGPTAKGSFVQTLVLTDIATGWTECALVREQGLLVEVLSELCKKMPFALLGFDTDNDSVFMNETVRDHCTAAGVEFTRCRPYRKNDQAWVEQKNGAVVRRIVGYRRLEGLEAAAALARLYDAVRLFVNFFQPSFKLAEKAREGATVRKRYHPPATPYQRLVADPRTSEEVRLRVGALHATLDPVQLLRTIRMVQARLVEIADRPVVGERAKPTEPSLEAFLSGLRTAWREGEVRPTARPKEKAERLRRRPDPFAAVTAQLQAWFMAELWRTSRDLLERLQAEQPGSYPAGLLRTLQRRVKTWRRGEAHRLVFGTATTEQAMKGDAAMGSGV